MRLRGALERDRPSVLALGVEEERAWYGEPESTAEEIDEWIDEEGGVAAGAVALSGDDVVAGFASAGRLSSVFLADPAQIDPVADLLVPWLVKQGRPVHVTTFAGDRARASAMERHGLRHLRSSFLLVRPAETGPLPGGRQPDGVEVTRYRLGEADAAVHHLVYAEAAWGAVPGHAERDLDGWRAMIASSSSMFIARRDGRPVGWVAGHVQSTGLGYVRMLAVAQTEQGRGLGRALLLRAFSDLQASGAEGHSLSVEASNEAALGLYRSVGLEIEREWRVYGSAPG